MSNLTAAIAAARTAKLQKIPEGFGGGKLRAGPGVFNGGLVSVGDEHWVVCRARVISDRFRLLDATVRQKLERQKDGSVPIAGAVAFLDPPKEGKLKRPKLPGDAYITRFQQIVWSAFRVAWILPGGTFCEESAKPIDRSGFDALVGRIRPTLVEPLRRRPKDSRAAEKEVLARISPVLTEAGFAPAPSRRYAGFWRAPLADGMWRRGDGRLPASFGLEVKLTEDPDCPLCQPVELLAHVDGVIHVRVGSETPKGAVKLADRAKALLEEHAPMKYLTLGVRS